MIIKTKDQLLTAAWELTVPENNPHSRFYGSMISLMTIVGTYMDKMGAPEDEKRRLIGHFGLTGETSNTISQLLGNIRVSLIENPTPSLEKTLQQAFLLSTMEQHPSQYSHMTHSGENVIAACNRIIDDIGRWTDEHVKEIAPVDRLKIVIHRREFARALNEIYDYIVGARGYFETHNDGVGVPEKYRRMIENYQDGITPPILQ